MGNTKLDLGEKLSAAYDTILERSREALASLRENTDDALHRALGSARDKAVELGELGRDEAERVHDFVVRDLHAAATHLGEQERDLADWLRLDLLLVEKEALSRYSALTERARAELRHLRKTAARYSEWHTGEITGLGTLRCVHCNKDIHFHRTGRVPPCPNCHGTEFRRV
ncbi:MAG: zinc ribbon-containing protein [Pseudomonadota bacterium]|nr:MAG: zinc ribbon-containing protein [Pseudomonadota bacterium]